MDLLWKTLGWGLVAGVIHFVVVGFLYLNPVVDRIYRRFRDHPGVRRWSSMKHYVPVQFLGTQMEVFIMAAAFFYLAPHLALEKAPLAIVTGIMFGGIRVYPRFWNMWIQSTYPRPLLAIEFVNGMLGTLTVTTALVLLSPR